MKTQWGLTAFLGALALSLAAAGEVIRTVDGRRIEGEIIQEDEDRVVIRTRYGPVTLSTDEIESIDRTRSPRAEYEQRRKVCDSSAQARYELGLWCKAQGLASEANDEFRIAYRLDPSHEGARIQLGIAIEVEAPVISGDYVGLSGEFEAEAQPLDGEEEPPGEGGGKGSSKGGVVSGGEVSPEDVPVPAGGDEAGTPAPGVVPVPAPPDTGGDPRWAWLDDASGSRPWEKREVRRTEHYVLESNVNPRYLDRYGAVLESMYGRYLKVFGQTPKKGSRCPVRIYASRDEFAAGEKDTLSAFGPSAASVGGFYQYSSGGGGQVVGYHGRFGDSGTSMTVLFHEGAHQFGHLTAGDQYRGMPIWVKEGLSVFFEPATIELETGEVSIGQVPTDRFETLKRALAGGTSVPIAELIRVPPSRFNAFHYAHAWGLVYWMVYTNRQNRAFFDTYYKRCTQGTVAPEDFERSIGVPMVELESRWKAWLLALDPAAPPRPR